MNIQWKIYVEDSEPFSKVNSSTVLSIEYKYLNIWIKGPSNIINICICTLSRVQIYLGSHSVNMLHPNIFGYLFGKLLGIQNYSDICLGLFYNIRSSLNCDDASVHCHSLWSYSDTKYFFLKSNANGCIDL